MKELEMILRRHGGRYPLMEPCDAVKLIYQNEFGGGHLIRDGQSALEYLRREYGAVEKCPGSCLLEPLGNGILRVNLAALEAADLEKLGEAFLTSAAVHRGSLPRFLEKLEVLKKLTAEGTFSFGPAELEAFLREYARAGYPMVSHSPRYRQAYGPAYRVVLADAAREFTAAPGTLVRAVAERIDDLCREKSHVLVAIEGRCASGKTTLAQALGDHYDCNVIHMDHFFLRPEQRTPERLEMPGENVDHERFLEEVLLPLRRGEDFSYRPFDCGSQNFGEPIFVPAKKLSIIEGSYCCHSSLWEHYDLRLFLTVPPDEQMRRLVARNGDYARVFREKWIPLEERYFAVFDLRARCDDTFTT